MTRSEAIGLLERGDSIVVTKSNDRTGDTYHFLYDGRAVTPRCFNSLRCMMAADQPGLTDDQPQTYKLDPEKRSKRKRA